MMIFFLSFLISVWRIFFFFLNIRKAGTYILILVGSFLIFIIKFLIVIICQGYPE